MSVNNLQTLLRDGLFVAFQTYELPGWAVGANFCPATNFTAWLLSERSGGDVVAKG